MVAKSAEAGGIGWGVLLGVDEEEVVMVVVVCRGGQARPIGRWLPAKAHGGAELACKGIVI